MQEFLTAELSATKKLTNEVMAAIKVLALAEQANQINRRLPPEAWYNELIRHDSIQLRSDRPSLMHVIVCIDVTAQSLLNMLHCVCLRVMP